MQSIRNMKSIPKLRLFLLLLSGAFCSLVQEPSVASEEQESDTYLFLGAAVMAESWKQHYPIVSVSKKRILVEDGDKLKKLPLRAACSLRTEWVLTENYAEVLEMKTSMKLLNDKNEMRAMVDMMRHERQSAQDAYNARTSGNRERAEHIEERNQDFQRSTQDALENGDFIKDGAVDTIKIDTSIIPQADFENAYMVACVTYDRKDPNSGKTTGKGGRAKAHFVGNLHAGEIHRIQINATVDQFQNTGAKVSMYLYYQNGEAIALSNASNLRRLTTEQVQKIRNQAQ